MSDKEPDDVNRPDDNQTQSTRRRIPMPPEIEENLKRVFQASLTEPVPDRFVQLLAQLREKEGKP